MRSGDRPRTLAANALLLARATDIRIGPPVDLELDCVHEIGDQGGWVKARPHRCCGALGHVCDNNGVDVSDCSERWPPGRRRSAAVFAGPGEARFDVNVARDRCSG